MKLSNLLGFGLFTVGTLFFAFSPKIIEATQSKTQTFSEPTTSTDRTTTSPRRLTVTVRVQEPEDLKVKEEDTIKADQVIADRERERSRLTSQKQQLQLSLQRLKSSSITPPTPPRPVPVVKALPPVSFAEHQAAIEKAKAAIAPYNSIN